MVVKPEVERVLKRRVRVCRHCATAIANYRAPSGVTRGDGAHDLCWRCFEWLVAWANRRRR